MSDIAPLQLACRFCRPLVEGCQSVFEVLLTSIVAEPVQDIVLEFRCAGLKGGFTEHRLPRPLAAFETLQIEVGIEPERKGTPPMTVHLHASTSRGRFAAHGSVRPSGQSGISILEKPENLQNLTIQIQEKAFFGSVFAEGGIDFGQVKSLNDFLQLHLPMQMEPVALSWDGFPVTRNLKPGSLFAKRFKLIEQLGQGGMGVVWLAEDTQLKSRLVAVKFLPETVCHDPDAIDDLKRELLLSQELSHENIVRIHDLIEAEGTVAISMEYIRGKNLSALRREQPSRVFSPDQLLPWVRQLCAALDYAHGKGIIHHDLKPLNLMINDSGVLKVCDFGLAGSMAESRSRHSRPGHTSGTTPYMSPQHLLLGSRTVADDIYAVGATLYELLTSKAPFYAGSIEAQIERGNLPSITDRRAVLRVQGAAPVPESWQRTVAACMDIVAEKRPASAGEILALITRTSEPKRSSPKTWRLPAAVGAAVFALGAWGMITRAPESIKEVPKVSEDSAAREEATRQKQRADELEKQAKEEQAKRLAAKAREAAAEEAMQSAAPLPIPLPAGGVGRQVVVPLPGEIKLNLCFCPAGSFMMGSPASEEGHTGEEEQVAVRLTEPFWMGRTELTQGQWVALMGSNPSAFKGDNLPVESVSAKDADTFIAKLNEKVPLKGWRWVLPTEAQWEYACRAGSPGPWGMVNSGLMGALEDMGWFSDNSRSTTHAVGAMKENAWGLCDMHGNVYEWCRDLWDGSSKLPGGTNPLGITGSYRVFRGGPWFDDAQHCRAANRYRDFASYRLNALGFRPAAVPTAAE